MKSRLVPFIRYLINYILLYDIVFLRNHILFMERFVSLGKMSAALACLDDRLTVHRSINLG